MPSELGVGLVYAQSLAPLLEERDSVDLLEVEPQVFWLASDGPYRYRDSGITLRRLADLPIPKLAHGAGSPIGGSEPFNLASIDRFALDVTTLGAIWASEHLSFNRAHGDDGPFDVGFPLPPRQTREAGRRIARNVRLMAARMPVPFAFETGVNYLQPRADELSDGHFASMIAEEADCGILLDLHSVWTNERNGRQSVQAFLAELPLDRVVEVHLAGGERAVPEALLDVARRVVPELPELRALVLEVVADRVPLIRLDVVREQIATLRRLWDARLSARSGVHRDGRRRIAARAGGPTTSTSTSQDEDIVEWESALGALALGRPASGKFAEELAADPGLPILRELVDARRADAAVDSLELTTRLLRLTLGREALQAILEAFWSETTPSPFGADEGVALATFLSGRKLAVPHFAEVLAFEQALLRIHRGGSGEFVRFTCDPVALLGALAEQRLPEDLPFADVEVLLSSDGSITLV